MAKEQVQSYKEKYDNLVSKIENIRKLISFDIDPKEYGKEVDTYIENRNKDYETQLSENDKQMEKINSIQDSIEKQQDDIDNEVNKLTEQLETQAKEAGEKAHKAYEILELFKYIDKDSDYYKAYVKKQEIEDKIKNLDSEIKTEDSQDRIDYLQDELDDLNKEKEYLTDDAAVYVKYKNELKSKGYDASDKAKVEAEYEEQNNLSVDANNTLNDGVEDYYYQSPEGINAKNKLKDLNTDLENAKNKYMEMKDRLSEIEDNLSNLKTCRANFDTYSETLGDISDRLDKLGDGKYYSGEEPENENEKMYELHEEIENATGDDGYVDYTKE